VFVLPTQTVPLPLGDAGAESGLRTSTARLVAGEVPQPLRAVTAMVPPAVPAVAVMEVVVEAPVHPPGSVQV
jgi:hypothetical protein